MGSGWSASGTADPNRLLHTDIGDVFNVLAENIFIQTNHRTVTEQIIRPVFLLLSCLNKQVIALLLTLFGNFRHLRIVRAAAQQIQHMLGAGQVQRFIAGDQADNFGVAFHQLRSAKAKEQAKLT